jgi:hypothetical protein
MPIDGDDARRRLEWMIDEFQQARRRWLVKKDVTEKEADTDGDIARSAARVCLSGERFTTS